ncbi:MAG: hypothetical protein LBC47_03845 [Tannerella sp.]|nr:hypothetical protein [Tannerella sp.]
MRARNNQEVVKAVIHFSAYMFVSVVLAVGIYSSFMQASVVEVRQILEKSGKYDHLQMTQVVLTETVDSMYYYAMLINSSDVLINQPAMFTMLSNKSISFNESLTGLHQDDCLNYKKLAGKLGDLIQLKDSIRVANVGLDVLKDEYIRCIEKNKNMRRRLFTGSIY